MTQDRNTATHTPGPWARDDYDASNDEIVIQTYDGEYVASIDCDGAYEGKIAQAIDATADLILAAPDMLEALRYADAEFERLGLPDDCSPRLGVRAAIAKAEGRK